MGGATADDETMAAAYRLGELIAENGWVLVNGGRPTGVMDASAKGAQDTGGGLSVGILYDDDREGASDGIDIVIPTGMGPARNIINVLASDVLIGLKGSGGTLSEIALALRFGRPVILLDFDPGEPFLNAAGEGKWFRTSTPEEAVAKVHEVLAEMGK
jgi:uncharacterized protein (TIGR00725 family)